MSRRNWTMAEVEALRRLYPDHTAEDVAAVIGRKAKSISMKANALGIGKSDAFLQSVRSGRIQRGRTAPRMVATQFQTGDVPWNKGLHYQPGGGSVQSRFTKGRAPQESHNYRPIGSLRVNDNGCLERKMTDDRSIASALRWTPVHRLVWEASHGPVPSGHVVVFRPGCKTSALEQITLDAIECITRQELIRRNTVHRYGRDIARLAQLRGALIRQINARAQEPETETTE